MEEGASKGIENEEELVPVSEVKKLEQRVRSLERMLGMKNRRKCNSKRSRSHNSKIKHSLVFRYARNTMLGWKYASCSFCYGLS